MKKLAPILLILSIQFTACGGGATSPIASPIDGSTPIINTVSGTFSHGYSVTISGGGFGSKSPAKPLVWADFKDGIAQADNAYSTLGFTNISGGFAIVSSDLSGHSSYCLGGIADNGTTAFDPNVEIRPSAPSSRFYVFAKRKYGTSSNFLDNVTNYKFFRLWPYPRTMIDVVMGYYNFRTPWSPSGGEIAYTVEGTGMTTETGTHFFNSGGVWHTEEFAAYQGTLDQTDGILKYWKNGQIVTNVLIKGRTTASPGEWQDLFIENYQTHTILNDPHDGHDKPPANEMVYLGDVYVDNTWARVMIGNNAVFDNCTRRDIQLPIAWSNTSITISFNQGSFNNGTTVYLFVVDSNGIVSSGKEITIAN